MKGRTVPTTLAIAFGRHLIAGLVLGALFAIGSTVTVPGLAGAVEVGQPAPDFKLASSTGGDVALSSFRGKKWVLLEFYSADFAPT